MTVPAFWGPDEDYHFNYVEYLTTQKAIIDPDKPTYPLEYPAVARATIYDSYGTGARKDFSGDPKRSVRRLGELPSEAREPRQRGRGAGVVHPPLYHVAGAIVNWSLGEASVLTRISAVKWLSSLIGALVVYFVWLLAAQVFRKEWLQLTAAFLVAVQPMIGFLSGIVNHDILLIAFFNAALAFMLFLLRTPPSARQGLWLGGGIALALLVKSSAFALLPLAGLAYVGQVLVYPDRWREVGKSATFACGMVLVLAGWWYVRSLLAYGSATGAVTAVVSSDATSQASASVSDIPNLVREWTGLTYRTYWFHYVFFEAPRGSGLFFVPAFVGALGCIGLAAYGVERRRTIFSPAHPRLRQCLLLLIAIFAVYLPFLGVDLVRRLNGEPFYVNGGRYLLPAYGAAVVLLLIGLRHLVRRQLFPWMVGLVAVLAAVLHWQVWVVNYVHRYFGEGSWQELFRRMSFDRPEFITPTTYTAVMVLGLLSLIAAAALVLVGFRREGTVRPPRDAQRGIAVRPAVPTRASPGSPRASP